MLPGRGMALVVKIVQQGSGCVKLQQLGALGARQAQPVCFGLAAGGYANLHSYGVLAQALADGPFG